MKKIILVLSMIFILLFTLQVFADSSKTITLKLGWNTVEDSVRGVVANKFKEAIEEKSNGKIKVET